MNAPSPIRGDATILAARLDLEAYAALIDRRMLPHATLPSHRAAARLVAEIEAAGAGHMRRDGPRRTLILGGVAGQIADSDYGALRSWRDSAIAVVEGL